MVFTRYHNVFLLKCKLELVDNKGRSLKIFPLSCIQVAGVTMIDRPTFGPHRIFIIPLINKCACS